MHWHFWTAASWGGVLWAVTFAAGGAVAPLLWFVGSSLMAVLLGRCAGAWATAVGCCLGPLMLASWTARWEPQAELWLLVYPVILVWGLWLALLAGVSRKLRPGTLGSASRWRAAAVTGGLVLGALRLFLEVPSS